MARVKLYFWVIGVGENEGDIVVGMLKLKSLGFGI